jgi:hypothetical protein
VKKASRNKKRALALSALRKESDRALVDLIRRRLALPVGPFELTLAFGW